MQNLKVGMPRFCGIRKFMIWNLFLMLVFTSTMATENSDIKESENSLSISEFDFKRMVLENKADTVDFNQFQKSHLELIPTWNYGNEFMILSIPLNKGKRGIVTGNGQMIFKNQE